ncbi:TetR/AcrR family transcriptional regulator [Sphingomicrobium clamense]|uniref:TetR/AcrR family transcriptional regulator n=1 Tax=Sphingomicrobium clamense TaxID=2851013 RepID=A0ABS6V893_9SPHN|nr:TetR/AcrR family transcriptional regulator [Sphingomicrobium sp. B8]MBW0145706.1 TetR/AcrR family transcriptional regulator [Sphingomicrobium sp. B8]
MATRKRMSPEESRKAALDAARDLLREEGMRAITLKAVAAKIGRTHANLLHHFGSVDELHGALADQIAHEVAASITGSIGQYRLGKTKLRHVVEEMFVAFREQGIGQMIAWVVLSGRREALEPIQNAVAKVVEDISGEGDERPLDRATLGLVLLAVGDSLVGEEMADATSLEHEASYDIAVKQVLAVLGEYQATKPRLVR